LVMHRRLLGSPSGSGAPQGRFNPAARRYAARLRIDVARRTPLVGVVGSDLADQIPATVVRTEWTDLDSTVGLDLPDVPEPAALPPAEPDVKRRKHVPANTTTPAQTQEVVDEQPAKAPAEDDLSLWI